ncbi:hypothetical protein BV20DRAFT_201212 [Pilatotrama ljubarskyi]|nr:hypothetical protein BV20DRAFT_201212 [Pilatotrama ljubarskyi]
MTRSTTFPQAGSSHKARLAAPLHTQVFLTRPRAYLCRPKAVLLARRWSHGHTGPCRHTYASSCRCWASATTRADVHMVEDGIHRALHLRCASHLGDLHVCLGQKPGLNSEVDRDASQCTLPLPCSDESARASRATSVALPWRHASAAQLPAVDPSSLRAALRHLRRPFSAAFCASAPGRGARRPSSPRACPSGRSHYARGRPASRFALLARPGLLAAYGRAFPRTAPPRAYLGAVARTMSANQPRPALSGLCFRIGLRLPCRIPHLPR